MIDTITFHILLSPLIVVTTTAEAGGDNPTVENLEPELRGRISKKDCFYLSIIYLLFFIFFLVFIFIY